jgi:methyl-accepting chemotaxis protein
MKNLKIGTKLYVMLAITLALIALVGQNGLSNLKKIENAANDMYNNRVAPLKHLKSFSDELIMSIAFPIQQIQRSDSIDKSEVYNLVIKLDHLKITWNNLENLMGAHTNKSLIEKTNLDFLEMVKHTEDILEAAKSMKKINSSEKYRFDVFFSSLNKTVQDVNQLMEYHLEEAEKISMNAAKIMESTKTQAMIIIIGGLILIFVLAVFLIRDIANKLKVSNKVINELAKGNLEVEIPELPKDELGEVIYNIEGMRDKLKEVVTTVFMAADNLSLASRELSSASQNISQGATAQASSTEEVSSSIEEMVSAIQENASNAKETEKIAENLADKTDKMVHAAVDSRVKINDIAEKISIIDEIAFQTNILALNAAVEAARAGEHGKGFGVVASEVGKLADRSKKAASEIEDLSKSSVNVIEEAGVLMQDIAPEINKTSTLIRRINNASQEQEMGANQINIAIQHLNEITQQNAAASEQIATSAEELSGQAEQLLQTMTFFKLDTKEFKVSSNTGFQRPQHTSVFENEAPPKRIKDNSSSGVYIDLGKEDNLDSGFEKF